MYKCVIKMCLCVKLRFPSMLCKRVWDDRCVLFNLSVVFVKIDEIGQLFFSVVVVGIGKKKNKTNDSK